MTQTFEQLIEEEYQLERKDICLTCSEYCWLHNPFIYCPMLDNQSLGKTGEGGRTGYRGLCQAISKGYLDNHSQEKATNRSNVPTPSFPDNQSQEINNSKDFPLVYCSASPDTFLKGDEQ